MDETVAARRATNLPAHFGTLFGRTEAVATIKERLLASESGLLTLTGAGGTGKTHLALAAATELLGQFADGVWLVELAPLTDPALVPAAVAASVHVSQQPGRAIRDTLLEALHDSSALLVLDNCEHVVDACAELVGQLLRSSRSVRVLATSREPLRTPHERTWRVPTLPAPDPDRVEDLDELASYASVRLFVEHAQAVQPGFGLSAHNGRAIATICARLDGLPLAVELAAARARVLSVEQILSKLDDSFGLLVGGSRTAPTRQQTLRATLDWSFRLLSSSEQSLFRRTAVFAGGFDLAAVETVCTGDDLADADLVEAVTGLVDKSLVLADTQDGVMRYRLLEPVRQYADDHLRTSGQWPATRGRHTAYFVGLAEEAEHRIEGPEQKPWMLRLDREHDNFRALLRHCLDVGEVETALRVGSALWLFWRQRGFRNEGERWLEEGLASGVPVSAAVRAKALRQVAELANAQSDYPRARARFAEALALESELDDKPGLAGTLLHFGRVLTRTGQTPEDRARGLAMLEESLELYRRLDQFWGAGWALQYVGHSAWEQGELERAAAALRDGIAVLEQGGGHHLRSHLVDLLGMVVGDMGDFDQATRLLEESLAESRATNCGEGTASAIHHLAGIGRRRGDLAGATTQCLEALRLYKKLGLQLHVAECLELLGGLAGDGLQPERSARLLAVADRVRNTISVQVPPVARPQLERDLARARNVLGSARFATAWQAGQMMTTDQAITVASESMATPATGSVATHPRDPLSPREREVVALLVRGHTNREIAQELVISERTADGHVANILSKLGLKTRAQVAVWAVARQTAQSMAAIATRDTPDRDG